VEVLKLLHWYGDGCCFRVTADDDGIGVVEVAAGGGCSWCISDRFCSDCLSCSCCGV